MNRARLREWVQSLKRDVHAIYLAARDPRVPWYAKLLAACVAAYALSPIDLIPDFIPVLGFLDDLLIVFVGAGLLLRAVPEHVLEEHVARYEQKRHQAAHKSSPAGDEGRAV